MKKNKTLQVLAVSFLLAVFFSSVNASGFSFIKDLNLKNSGAAGALMPYSSDAFSTFVNPAGLAYSPVQEIQLVYNPLFEGSYLSAISYACPLLYAGAFSVSYLMLDNSGIEERDASNNLIKDFSEIYGGFYASYGATLEPLPFIKAGAGLKFLYHNFYNINSSAWGLDAGVTAELPLDIRLSLAVENIVKPEFTYASGRSDLLPFIYDFSAGWSAGLIDSLDDSLKIAAGITKAEYSDYGWKFGAEYSVLEMFALRAGLNNEGFSAGASAAFSGIGVNYAFVSMPLDYTHRVSLSFGFGDNIRAKEIDIKSREDKLKQQLIVELTSGALDRLKTETDALILGQKYDDAKSAIDKALAWDPKNSWFIEKEKEVLSLITGQKIKALMKQADEQSADKFYLDALVNIKSILQLDPSNQEAKDKAVVMQQFIEKQSDENISAEVKNRAVIKEHFSKGLEFYTSGNYEASVKEWQKVINASPLQRQVYDFVKKAEDKIKQKEESLQKAVTVKETEISKLYNSAVLLYTKGEFEESLNAWRRLLTLDPENTEAKRYIEKITEEYMKLQKQNLQW